MVQIKGFGSREDLRASLEKTEFQNSKICNNQQKKKLLDEIAAFIYYRFMQNSAEEYKDWRLDSGYHWRSLDVMRDTWFIDEGYNIYFGEKPPSDIKLEETFDRFWTAALEFHHGTNRPVALAAEPKGLICRFSYLTEGNPEPDPIGGEMPPELWYGGVSMTMRSWFDPPRSLKELLKEYNRVLAAEAGVIFQFADGSRRPVFFMYYWDPGTSHWWLEYINQNNYRWQDVSALEY